MNEELLERAIKALETLALCVDQETKTLRMVDVKRGEVYKTHLGQRLSTTEEKQ